MTSRNILLNTFAQVESFDQWMTLILYVFEEIVSDFGLIANFNVTKSRTLFLVQSYNHVIDLPQLKFRIFY